MSEQQDLKRAHERLEHLNAVLKAVRSLESLVLKEHSISRLLRRACRLLTRSRGYYSAWIVVSQPSDTELLAASRGVGPAFAKIKSAFAKDHPPACCRQAVESSSLVVITDPNHQCTDCPLFKIYGEHAGLVRHLSYESSQYGIMTLSVPTAYAADEEELQLVNEIADILGYALHNIYSSQDYKAVRSGLQEARDDFQKLFNQSVDAIIIHDLSGHIFEANEAALTLFETDRATLLERPLQDFAPGVTQETIHKTLDRAGTLEVARASRNLTLKNGRVIPIEVLARKFKYNGQDAVIANIRDISDRLNSQRELLIRNFAIESSLSAIGLADLNGRIIDVNKAYLDLWQYADKTAVLGGAIYQTAPNPAEIESIVRQVKEKGYARGEGEILRSDGSVLHVEYAVSLVTDKSGQPLCLMASFVDITKRIKAQEALKASAQQYASMFHRMLDGYALHEMIFDEHGAPADYRFLEVNPAFERLTGLKGRDIIDRTVLEVMPDIESSWIDRYGSVVISGEPLLFENYSRELGKHFKVTAYRVQSNQFAVLFEDITVQKETQLRLLESEKHFRDVLESIQLIGVTLDPEGRLTFANDYFLELTGYTQKEVLGCNWFDTFLPGDVRHQIKQGVFDTAVSGTGFVPQYENEILTRAGDRRLVRWNNTVNYNLDGNLVGTTSIGEDVTQRRQDQEAIVQEKERAQQYLDIAGVMFIAIDREGIITRANKKAAEILQCDEENILGQNWFDTFLDAENIDEIKTMFQKIMDGQVEQFAYYENSVRTASGNSKIIAWYNTVLRDDKGQIIGSLSSGEDITERRITEEALNQKMEELERFNRLMVGRELKMASLKQEVNRLCSQAGLEPRYQLLDET